MDHPSSPKPPKHHNLKGDASGSTNKQIADPSQFGPPVAKKGTHTSAGQDGAFITEDSSDPEVIGLKQQMDLLSMSRGPPDRSFSTHRAKKSSSTQPQTHRRSEVQTQPPASFVQGSPAATATGDRHAQPRTQTSTWGQPQQGQPQQVSHGQTHQVPHGQMHQVPHGQTYQVPHGQTHQMPHGQTHQVLQRQVHQVSHGQPHQMSHGQTHQLPYGQTHVSQGQTSQPTQVQMPRATGGTSSYGQQRSADKPRKSDYMPAATATANQRATGGSSRR